MAEDDGTGNEYFTRPYSAESIRWRVEAMCIRRETVDDGSGPVLAGAPDGHDAWSRRATVIAVFNPKGGVGKTTVATNLASSLQAPQGQVRPAHRRRHGHRPRHDVARHRGGADGRRQLARRGRRRPGRDAGRARLGPRIRAARRRPDRFAAQHRDPRPRAGRRPPSRWPDARSTSSSSTCTRPTARSTRPSSTRPTGSSCRSRRTCRPSAPPSSSSTSPSPSAAASACRWSSTGPTAACPSPTWSAPSAMTGLRPDPIRRAALRAGRQRGPYGHRDVPAREDHGRLRRPRRPPPRRPEARGQRPLRLPLPVTPTRPRLTRPARCNSYRESPRQRGAAEGGAEHRSERTGSA